jgi:hypothetical protein
MFLKSGQTIKTLTRARTHRALSRYRRRVRTQWCGDCGNHFDNPPVRRADPALRWHPKLRPGPEDSLSVQLGGRQDTPSSTSPGCRRWSRSPTPPRPKPTSRRRRRPPSLGKPQWQGGREAPRPVRRIRQIVRPARFGVAAIGSFVPRPGGLRSKFFLDNCFPDSLAHVLREALHDVILLRDVV